MNSDHTHLWDDRLVFERLVYILRGAQPTRKILDESCSGSTLRRRRDEWVEAGATGALDGTTREAYDRTIGPELSEMVVGFSSSRFLSAARRQEGARLTGKTGHQALRGRRVPRHPAWGGERPGQPPRLTASGRDARHLGGSDTPARESERLFRPRLRLGGHQKPAYAARIRARDLA